jgi:hypothetical protein
MLPPFLTQSMLVDAVLGAFFAFSGVGIKLTLQFKTTPSSRG